MNAPSLAPTRPSTMPPVKACSCGRHYSARRWSLLQLVAANWEGLCLRNCNCGSTIAIEVEEQS